MGEGSKMWGYDIIAEEKVSKQREGLTYKPASLKQHHTSIPFNFRIFHTVHNHYTSQKCLRVPRSKDKKIWLKLNFRIASEVTLRSFE